MFDSFEGRLAIKKPSHVVVDCGGVGYRLSVSLTTYAALPAEGQRVRLYAYLKVSDDDLALYGFSTEAERGIFTELVGTVSQLGPRRAMAILSSAPAATLREIVDAGDTARLRQIKGIGPKMADKIVFELKGRLPKDEGLAPEDASKKGDAVHALVSLGYDRREADAAVAKVIKSDGALEPEELVRRALRFV